MTIADIQFHLANWFAEGRCPGLAGLSSKARRLIIENLAAERVDSTRDLEISVSYLEHHLTQS